MSCEYRTYNRKGSMTMTPWTPDIDMTDVSVSQADRDAGSPKEGDMIARNPQNHNDRWLVAKLAFETNYHTTPVENPS